MLKNDKKHFRLASSIDLRVNNVTAVYLMERIPLADLNSLYRRKDFDCPTAV